MNATKKQEVGTGGVDIEANSHLPFLSKILSLGADRYVVQNFVTSYICLGK